MARAITDIQVSEVNDTIAQAKTEAQAYRLVMGLTRTMLDRVMDLNHVDPDRYGRGRWARERVLREHGWNPFFRDDDRPADGHGPCDLGKFEPHSRRPWECRGCKRRPIDHRPV